MSSPSLSSTALPSALAATLQQSQRSMDRPSTPYYPWMNQQELLMPEMPRITAAEQVSRVAFEVVSDC